MTEAIVKRAGAFSETVIDDEIVVMTLATGDFFSLTGSAAAIWRLIDGKRDRAGVLAELAEAFAADPLEIGGDLDQILGQLRAAGLLEPG